MKKGAISRIILVLIAGASAALGQQLAADHNELLPAPGNVIAVTGEPGFHNEPSIAVNSRNPAQIFAAYQVPASVTYSQDGGASWKLATGTAPTDYKVSGDVATTYDKNGTAILCYIAFDQLGTENYWAHGATRNGVFVRRSSDGGATWDAHDHAVLAQLTKPGIPFEDKPGIAADVSDSKYAGNVYVGWTEFRLDESVILFSRSSDGGSTWSPAIEISTHHGLPRDDNGAVEGFEAAVGSDGTIYSVWADGDSIAFASSRDGGKTFSKSRSIIHTAPLYFAVQGLDRANGFPQISIDPHHGKHGRLFVTWSDYRDGDIGIFCATSEDGGRSWSNAVRVNSNRVHDGTDQFFQWLAVDPVTGTANVIFYDRRSDPQNRKTLVTLARSTDGGLSFTNYSWSREAFLPTRNDFLGDYIGVAAYDNRVYGVWAELTPPNTAPSTKASPQELLRGPRTVVKVGEADFGKAAAQMNKGQ